MHNHIILYNIENYQYEVTPKFQNHPPTFCIDAIKLKFVSHIFLGLLLDDLFVSNFDIQLFHQNPSKGTLNFKNCLLLAILVGGTKNMTN